MQILNGVLVGADLIMVEIKEMDDSEVDLADFVGVVVDESDDFLGVIALEHQFFHDFTFDAVEIGGFGEGVFAFIDRIDVTADADALLGVEAFFTGFSATGVNEVFPLMMKDGVGDDLLVGGVKLGVGAGKKEISAGGEDGVQVAFGFRLEALEGTQFIKQCAGDDKDVFYGHNGVRNSKDRRAQILCLKVLSGRYKTGRLSVWIPQTPNPILICIALSCRC